LKRFGEDIKAMKRAMMRRSGRMRVKGRMGEEMEGIKRGALPYVATSLFPPPTIMIMQTTTWLFYFNFVITMIKWKSSIQRFR
jgi:hypothetical protein